jgi:hypothetical protein
VKIRKVRFNSFASLINTLPQLPVANDSNNAMLFSLQTAPFFQIFADQGYNPSSPARASTGIHRVLMVSDDPVDRIHF